MRTDCFLIRYGDMARELAHQGTRFDTLFGYSEQYDFALPERAVVFGKRDRFSRTRAGERVYYTFPTNYPVRGRLPRWTLRILGELWELILMVFHRPRVVVVVGGPVDMPVPFLFSRFFRVPMVAVFHDEVPPERLLSKISAKIVNSPNVIAITNGLLPRDRLVSLGAKPEKIMVHSIYLPPEFFVEKPIEKWIDNSKKFKIFYIGRFTQEKGVLDLPDIVQYVVSEIGDECEFFFIGDGPLRNVVEREIARRGFDSSVHFLGMKPSDMIYSYLRAADVVIVPSYAECFGKILAEAMSAQTPAVAYSTGGLAYQINDGVNGFLVPTGDRRAMAEKIVLLYKNPELRRKISQNLAPIRKKYSNIEKTLGYMLRDILRKLLRK